MSPPLNNSKVFIIEMTTNIKRLIKKQSANQIELMEQY